MNFLDYLEIQLQNFTVFHSVFSNFAKNLLLAQGGLISESVLEFRPRLLRTPLSQPLHPVIEYKDLQKFSDSIDYPDHGGVALIIRFALCLDGLIPDQ